MILIAAWISAILFGQHSWADANSSSYSAQRKNFLKAEDALSRHHFANYRRFKKRLKDYPLLPYLEYEELALKLSKRPKKRTDLQLERFLNDYPDLPITPRLKKLAFEHAVKFSRIDLAKRFFNDNVDAKTLCSFLQLVLKSQSELNEYFDVIDRLWLNPKSLPKHCDPILSHWHKAGRRTNELIWQRLILASQHKQKRLASYLIRLLPEKDKALGRLWLRLANKPSLISKVWPTLLESEKQHGLLLYALKQLSLANPEKALALWQELPIKSEINRDSYQRFVNKLASHLASHQSPETLPWIESLPSNIREDSTRRWQTFYYLVAARWHDALRVIGEFAKPQKAKWRYWNARALAEIGNSPAAVDIFNELANSRGYYGFLAASVLGRAGTLDHTPLFIPDLILNRIEKMPAIARAKELFLLERIVDARREWQSLKKRFPSQELFLAAGVLADQWGWHDRAIVSLAAADFFDDLDIRFPTPHLKTIRNYSEHFQVPTSLALAVARQESIFMTDSRSGAGALGIMQVLPTTAKEIARRYQIQYPGNFRLLEPEKNIQFGTAYLNRLLRFKEDNIVLTAAAYNAGPFRVKRWRQRLDKLPEDLFIEMIPFRETRQYVKNVLAYQYIYSLKLNQSDNPFGHIVNSLATSFGAEKDSL